MHAAGSGSGSSRLYKSSLVLLWGIAKVSGKSYVCSRTMLLQHFISICLAGIAATAATTDGSSSSIPSCKSISATAYNTENVDQLAACNKADLALVQFNAESNPSLCETWLNRYAPESEHNSANH